MNRRKDDETYLESWPGNALPARIGEKAARLFARRPPGTDKHYKEACAWYGALKLARAVDDTGLLTVLRKMYAPFAGSYGELLSGAGHVDNNVFGIVPLQIAIATGDVQAGNEGLALADHQRTNIDTQMRFAIDDMFMITALQVQAWRFSGSSLYLDCAAAAMARYLRELQQEDGLFVHHRDFRHRWGRGNGWVAAGMAELITVLPPEHEHAPRIKEGYAAMMKGLLPRQVQEGPGAGLWNQIIDSPDERNWPETSGSAMFCYAMITGLKHGLLQREVFGPAVRRAWLGLCRYVTPSGEVRNVSKWAYKPYSHPESGDKYDNDEANYYFDREKCTGDNHGQAPLLWCAAALL
ncbi:MAG: glycoside hydrolase family 88 protein [Spirochaetales bacterium]|nr:glycoside hydrolase family 88 protein [Spirochaetales bacterium]